MANSSTWRLVADAEGAIDEAAAILRAGGLVAMPTETVYGLAANALDRDAVRGIFEAKQRPAWDPLIVHIADLEMLALITAAVQDRARVLMERFWPGPLTLLLPRSERIPDEVTAGRPLVGVRMPAHPVARELIYRAGIPLAAPSANRFGHISPTTAEHVLADLNGRIAAVLDAGPCSIGVESTVLDPSTDPMVLYRQGGVSAAEIEQATQAKVRVYLPPPRQSAAPASLPSPGVGIRHYAPRARVTLVNTPAELASAAAACEGKRFAVLLPSDWPAIRNAAAIVDWGNWDDPAALSRKLYSGLRSLDAEGVAEILIPLPPATGRDLSDALRDRLEKAARNE